MVKYKIASKSDIELLMQSRLEMLKMVNDLPSDYAFSEEAKEKGVTEISLDATEAGRPLYKKCGFVESDECMVLNLN